MTKRKFPNILWPLFLKKQLKGPEIRLIEYFRVFCEFKTFIQKKKTILTKFVKDQWLNNLNILNLNLDRIQR